MSVSIIIPTFNSVKTIAETLNSVKAQTFPVSEIIVIDDGSKDDTFNFVKNNYPEVQIYSQTNSGPSKARNHGAEKATGEFIIFLDADDILNEKFIEKCINEFKKNDRLEIVYPILQYFGNRNDIWELPEFEINSFLINNCIPIYAMIRRESFLKAGKFDENLTYTEDWELWIRMIKNGGEVKRINEVLYYYRKNEEQNSLTDRLDNHATADKSRLYIYNKHYDFFSQHNLSITKLCHKVIEYNQLKSKYDNIWYRKLKLLFKNK